ncbi:MAG: HPr family phosphocarrier protein [Treponema sp.]|jgi:phosphocarrier protein|nr:HPr family phosphocarrier protein [Treponema sp.]
MTKITYRIDDEMGLHARPAGLLVKMAAKFKSDIQLGTPAKMVNAKRIIGVMSLTLKQGQEMTMTFDGEDEQEAAAAVGAFLEENSFSRVS